jgi:hypothetical protein
VHIAVQQGEVAAHNIAHPHRQRAPARKDSRSTTGTPKPGIGRNWPRWCIPLRA